MASCLRSFWKKKNESGQRGGWEQFGMRTLLGEDNLWNIVRLMLVKNSFPVILLYFFYFTVIQSVTKIEGYNLY